MIHADPLTGEAYEGANPPTRFSVPLSDAAAYSAWYAAQNFPPPAEVPVVYSPSEYAAEVQARLDTAAQARNYDGIVSACSYAGFPNAFQSEGIAFGQWRSAVWAFVYAAQQQPPAGPAPSPTQFADYVFSQIPAPSF